MDDIMAVPLLTFCPFVSEVQIILETLFTIYPLVYAAAIYSVFYVLSWNCI